MTVSEELRVARERICLEHMTAENAHEFERCIGAFSEPRYEIVATAEVYDGPAEVGRLLKENLTAFPDFHFDAETIHHADDALVVEGTFRGTHLGQWRALPATGKKVEVSLLIIFRFEGERMTCERVFFDLNSFLMQMGVAWDPNSTMGKVTTVLTHPLTIASALLRKVLPQ